MQRHQMLATLWKAFATIPVLPIGVSRHFWAVAYIYIGASPNNLIFMTTSTVSYF